ncbi:MAG: hypothetical protein PHF86_12010 [Candidatus Nanoarchaeia archaeon]|nr:hypothetical protein [Candidatus Nanoarchaeia archaeon]
MSLELEKAQIMFKLARKDNWNACYDRTEHFKRFQNLDLIIKELSKLGWLIIHKKPNYTGISLNTKYKKEIIELIEKEMPYVKGAIK